MAAVLTPVSSGCSLLESPELGPRAFGCNAWDDDLSWESECGLKKPGTTADDCTAATAATTAFNTEEYVDLLDLGEEAKNTANDEAKILDDLLRLGLELGDLEDVFGNTDIDASRSEEVKVVEEYQDDGNGDEETGQSEPVVYAGPELMKDDAEELLLGADLQDALLALPKDLAEEQDDDESAREPTTTPLAITDEKALLPPPKPSLAPPQVSPETTAASPSVAPDMTLGDTAVDNDHAAHCASMEHSDAEILNVDALDAGNAAAGALIPTTTIPVTGAAACGVERGATVSSSTGAVSGDTKNALESDCSSSSGGGASSSYNFEDIDVSSAIAAPPGVPIHLLDAVDLWESANAQKKNSAGEAKKSHGKKKNEFGKRRRSSGAGGHAPGPGLALDPPSGASSSLAAGRGRRVKKDPLAAVKDVRNLSRKPLIVQWLRSDGCELDPEAESTVGNAVGKLSMIHSHYWSGGG